MIKPDDIKIEEFNHSKEMEFIPLDCTLLRGGISFREEVLLDDRYNLIGLVGYKDHAKEIVRRRIWRNIYPEPSPEDPVGGYTEPYFDEIVDDIEQIVSAALAVGDKGDGKPL